MKKTMKNINILLLISLIFSMIWNVSCDESYSYNEENVDCNKCYEDFPEFIELEMKFYINSKYSSVIYTIYNGYAENSPVVYYDTARWSVEFVYLEPNKFYSFVAEYYDAQADAYYYVVNECHPKTSLVRGVCSSDCYYVENDFVNLALKFGN